MGKDWKYAFKDKMSDYSKPAPEGLWDRIEAGVTTRRTRRRAWVWRSISGLAAAAAITLFAVLFMGEDPKTGISEYGLYANAEGFVEDPGADDDAEVLGADDDAEVLGADANPGVQGGTSRSGAVPAEAASAPEFRTDNVLTQSATTPKTRATVNASAPPTAPAVLPASSGLETDHRAGVERGSKSAPEIDIIRSDKRDWQDLMLADSDQVSSKSKKRRSISLNVFGSGFFSGSETSTGYSQAVTTQSVAALYTANSAADIMTFNRSKSVNTDTKHYLPIKAGVTVAWEFAPRWSVETGIMYSWLLSKSRTGSDSYYIDSRQRVHYLGIPLNIGFDFFRNERMRIYASAGGMVEKNVGGNVELDYIYGNETRNHESEHLNIKPLQWSTTLSAGVQYRFSDFFGLYLEPGMIYHFPTDSGVATSYTEHPLNFHLALGLRFTLK